jgi:hypothetical protein
MLRFKNRKCYISTVYNIQFQNRTKIEAPNEVKLIFRQIAKHMTIMVMHNAVTEDKAN